MLLLSEKRSLTAVKHYVDGALFASLHSPDLRLTALGGYIEDVHAFVTKALEQENGFSMEESKYNLAHLEKLLELVADSCHVPSGRFGQQALNVLRSTR